MILKSTWYFPAAGCRNYFIALAIADR